MSNAGKIRISAQSHEPHDENGVYSPPCFLREIDPAYAGYLTRAELVELLNELLEGERAVARAAASCLVEANDENTRSALRGAAGAEAQFCAMLSRHIEGLGGTPSTATGALHDKLLAVSGLSARIVILVRGQGWIVRRLRDALRCVQDDLLYGDLKLVLQVREANIARLQPSTQGALLVSEDPPTEHSRE